MRKVVLSPRARSDLSGIWDYTFEEWGVEQAEKYVRELWDEIQLLARDHSASTDISDVRAGYRKTKAGSHIIFFRLIDDGIDVIRILHQRMDFDRHL